MHSSLEREDQAPQREGNYGQALREKATMAKLSGEAMALSKMRAQ